MEFAKALVTLTKVKLSLNDPRLKYLAISNLKILMAVNRISQSKLANMVGVKKPTISMFMTGKKGRQPVGLLVQMADMLGVDVNVLFEKDLVRELMKIVRRGSRG